MQPKTIKAVLTGSNQAEAEGHCVQGNSPVFALCRKLVAGGFDPNRPLEAYRDQTLCLRVPSIGQGAGLTVKDSRLGQPRFARKVMPQPHPRRFTGLPTPGHPTRKITHQRGRNTPLRKAA